MAITRTATPTSSGPITATGAQSFAHTCAASTSLLLLVIQVEALNTISGTPTWNTNENFTLIRNTGTGTASGDVRQLIYGLVNPTAGTANIAFTISGSILLDCIAFGVSYLGTETSSIAAAAIYLDEQINNAAATTVAMNAAVGGTAGRTAFAAANFFGGDGDPASETASGGQFASPMFNSATGTSTTTDRSYYVADQINWTPAAVTVDWTSTASDECVGTVIELVPLAVPTITSIDTDNDTVDTRTGVPVVGTNFGSAGTGSFKVEVSNNATYGSGTVVQITAAYNSSTSITVEMERSSDQAALAGLFTLPLSPAYLWVTDSAGSRNATGFQFTLRPPGPTAFANLNTSATLEVDTTYLLRLRAENSGGVGGTVFALWCSRNAGAYFKVTTTSSVVKAVAASAFNTDDDVPETITGTGTYITNNNGATETGTITLPAAFNAGGAINAVFSIQVVGADVSDEDALLFRLGSASAADFGTYTNTASATVNKVGGATITLDTGAIAVAGTDLLAAQLIVLDTDDVAVAGEDLSALTTITLDTDDIAAASSDLSAAQSVLLDIDDVAVAGADLGILADTTFVLDTGAIGVAGTDLGILADTTLVLDTGAVTAAGNEFEPLQQWPTLPDAAFAVANLQDTDLVAPAVKLSDLTDDPASADSNWWTAVNQANDTEGRIGFASPGGGDMSGPQPVQLWLRKSGTANPTANIELWLAGVFEATLATGVSITSATGQLVEVNFDGTGMNKADVEIRVVGLAA